MEVNALRCAFCDIGDSRGAWAYCASALRGVLAWLPRPRSWRCD
ncbi:hypothetical protein HMPREF0970_01084 [Schaalia odontolytica F0309]|uniref:Uncharacterized protein n=1 Tax=Schaalia odontolytica F0309 TaxID=649742 RepID=D4TYQ9_9ACTO|nr:hypothetical protein HMPREF0970_01084 [Schaalia odontolytica F0309]